jgi:hypothetical protein
VTRESLWLRVRNGFRSDEELHQRNIHQLEEYLDSAHVGTEQLVDGAVGQAALGAGAVADAAVSDVSWSKITDGEITAIGTLIGEIVAGSLKYSGSTGISLVDSTGAVLFSVRSGDEPFIRGQVEATGLLVENDFVLRGTNNLIEAGANIRMGGAAAAQAVGNPGAAPGLSVEWEKFALPANSISLRRGLAWDGTNTSWWTVDQPGTTTGPLGGRHYDGRLLEYDNDASKTFIRSKDMVGSEEVYGAVRVGTRVYVLMRHTNGNMLIRAFNEADLAFLGQVNVNASITGTLHGKPGLGDDGTNLVVVDADTDGANAILRFHKFTRADVPVYASTTTSSGAGNPTAPLGTAVSIVGFVSVESSWWVALSVANVVQRVEAFSTAGAYQANKSFENGESLRGLTHDGTQFWSLGATSLIKHTNWKWTTESDKYWVAYTYVDDNGTASVGARPLGAGDFETKKSPTASATMKRRARLRMSAAAVDTALTGITHVGWYIERGAGTEPTLDFNGDSAVTNGVQTSRTIEDFATDASPEAPPGTNTFPAASAANFAAFMSSDGSPILRADGISRFKGEYTAGGSPATGADTYVRLGTETKDTDSYHPATTDAINATPDSTYDITLPFTGQYLVVATDNFAANATGRRDIFMDQNGGLVARHTETPQSNTAAFRGNLVQAVDATVGDTLRFGVFQSSGAGLALNNFRVLILFLGPA